MRRRNRYTLPLIADLSMAALAFLCLALLRLLPCRASIGLAGRTARVLTPVLPRSRLGMENLKRAFPDLSRSERHAILRAMWDNSARTMLEYLYLDRVFDYDPDCPEARNIETVGVENFIKLRQGRRPAIIFTGHLANWELLSICAAKHGLDVASFYRPPNNRFLAHYLTAARSKLMGDLVASKRGSVFELAAILERNGRIGLLVDQRFHGGVLVPFFGHLADTSPLLAKLARQYECAVHGARAIRLNNGRFRLELTDELELPRDGEGHIDVEKTTALVAVIVEGWVREHPEQWLWVHRRWRLGPRSRMPTRSCRASTSEFQN